MHARHIVYRIIRPWGRWGVSLWHRIDRQVVGAEHLDDRGPDGPARLLFAGHQNGLADPVLACVLLEPQLHFFTRADVFRNRWARALLLRLNMMPIFRPKDRVKDMADRNRATFEAAQQRLERGATCGIFPEAGHREERRIRRFRHGSARFIAGALQRPAVAERGLEVLPMNLDFERYEGYRTAARVRVAAPIDLSGIPGLAEDAGSARVVLSDRMREALIDCSLHLLEGDAYEPHLAVCRYLEGALGGRVSNATLQLAGQQIMAEADTALRDYQAALDAGWGAPRTSDDFAAAGRCDAERSTALLPHLWRWPAWILFMATAGWWPRIIAPAAARRVKQVAFRTTFSIPVNMMAVSMTWIVLSLGLGVAMGSPWVVPLSLLLLRGAQHVAMPLEDALIDNRTERRVSSLPPPRFVERWCRPLLEEAHPAG